MLRRAALSLTVAACAATSSGHVHAQQASAEPQTYLLGNCEICMPDKPCERMPEDSLLVFQIARDAKAIYLGSREAGKLSDEAMRIEGCEVKDPRHFTCSQKSGDGEQSAVADGSRLTVKLQSSEKTQTIACRF